MSEQEIEDAWTDIHAAPLPGHRVVWSIEPESVRGEFICLGDLTSPCHVDCPAGCELSPCVHAPVFRNTCGVIEWFEDTAETYYNGPQLGLRDSLIVVAWDGDCYLWHYVEEGSGSE